MTYLLNKIFENEVGQSLYLALFVTYYIECVAGLVKDTKKFKKLSKQIRNIKLVEGSHGYVFNSG